MCPRDLSVADRPGGRGQRMPSTGNEFLRRGPARGKPRLEDEVASRQSNTILFWVPRCRSADYRRRSHAKVADVANVHVGSPRRRYSRPDVTQTLPQRVGGLAGMPDPETDNSSATSAPRFEPDECWVPADARFFGVDRRTIAPTLAVFALAVVMSVVLPVVNIISESCLARNHVSASLARNSRYIFWDRVRPTFETPRPRRIRRLIGAQHTVSYVLKDVFGTR